MSDADVRLMLMSGSRRTRDRLLGYDREVGGHVENVVVESIQRAAQGLPLFVRYVLYDLEAGRLNLEAVASQQVLPRSLDGYHRKALRELGVDDRAALLGPLLAALALAREPLTPAALAALCIGSRDGERLDVSLVHHALTSAESLIRESADPQGDTALCLVHLSLREHLASSGNVRQLLASIARRYALVARGFPEVHPSLRGYVLKHGVAHLVDQGEHQRAFELLTDSGYVGARLALEGEGAFYVQRADFADLRDVVDDALLEPVTQWLALYETRIRDLRTGGASLRTIAQLASEVPALRDSVRSWVGAGEGSIRGPWLRPLLRKRARAVQKVIDTGEQTMRWLALGDGVVGGVDDKGGLGFFDLETLEPLARHEPGERAWARLWWRDAAFVAIDGHGGRTELDGRGGYRRDLQAGIPPEDTDPIFRPLAVWARSDDGVDASITLWSNPEPWEVHFVDDGVIFDDYERALYVSFAKPEVRLDAMRTHPEVVASIRNDDAPAFGELLGASELDVPPGLCPEECVSIGKWRACWGQQIVAGIPDGAGEADFIAVPKGTTQGTAGPGAPNGYRAWLGDRSGELIVCDEAGSVRFREQLSVDPRDYGDLRWSPSGDGLLVKGSMSSRRVFLWEPREPALVRSWAAGYEVSAVATADADGPVCCATEGRIAVLARDAFVETESSSDAADEGFPVTVLVSEELGLAVTLESPRRARVRSLSDGSELRGFELESDEFVHTPRLTDAGLLVSKGACIDVVAGETRWSTDIGYAQFIHADDRVCVYPGGHGGVGVVDTRDGALRWQTTDDFVDLAERGPDESILLFGKERMTRRALADGAELASGPGPEKNLISVHRGPLERTITLCFQGGQLWVLDATTLEIAATVQAKWSLPLPIAGHLLLALKNKRVALWRNGEETWRSPASAKQISTAAASQTGEHVAYAAGREAYVTSTSEPEARHLAGHQAKISHVAVSSTHGFAVSAAEDGNVRVWDLASGGELATWPLSGKPTACRILSNGRLVLGDEEGNIYWLVLER